MFILFLFSMIEYTSHLVVTNCRMGQIWSQKTFISLSISLSSLFTLSLLFSKMSFRFWSYWPFGLLKDVNPSLSLSNLPRVQHLQSITVFDQGYQLSKLQQVSSKSANTNHPNGTTMLIDNDILIPPLKTNRFQYPKGKQVKTFHITKWQVAY